MNENDELKPIEEIDGGAAKPKPDIKDTPTAVPIPQVETPATSAPQAPTVPVAPMPSATYDAGKQAVIKRTGPDGGWVKYLILAIIVLVIGGGIFYYFFYRVTFEINPSPDADKVLLDNNEIKVGTYRVKPGVHTLDIEKAGYISYISSKKYSFGEHVVLNFKFQEEKSPVVSVPGSRLASFSKDKKYLFFLNNNSNIAVLDLGTKDAQASTLSSAQYPSAKILEVSKDKNFAILLDSEAIKIINFNKVDLVNQSETKLPPLASGIHSLTWNNNESKYFAGANSKIMYDLQSSTSWDVFMSNLAHSQTDMIMQIDQSAFPNLYMDWGDSPNRVLVAGGELGILDISKRDYQKISSDKQFLWGKWSPDGQSAISVDSEGGVWLYRSDKFSKLPFTSKEYLVDFIDNTNVAALSQGRPIKYNFDTQQEVNYAEVKGLSGSSAFITKEDVFYFETTEGIFSGRFEQSGY